MIARLLLSAASGAACVPAMLALANDGTGHLLPSLAWVPAAGSLLIGALVFAASLPLSVPPSSSGLRPRPGEAGPRRSAPPCELPFPPQPARATSVPGNETRTDRRSPRPPPDRHAVPLPRLPSELPTVIVTPQLPPPSNSPPEFEHVTAPRLAPTLRLPATAPRWEPPTIRLVPPEPKVLSRTEVVTTFELKPRPKRSG